MASKRTARDEWREQFNSCMVCGWPEGRWRDWSHERAEAWQKLIGPLQVHHIARGNARARAENSLAVMLLVCPPCHETEMDDYSRWPIARQLALKKLRDPEHYDRIEVNRLRAPLKDAAVWETMVTEAEVDEFLAELRK